MYLVTSPDNVLLGARETLREAKQFVESHALRPRKGETMDAQLLTIADPVRWQKLLSSYRVERVR
jgi:hypothetical protein